MAKLELKHIVSPERGTRVFIASSRKVEITDIATSDETETIQTKHGIKLAKNSRGYIVIDRKKRVFLYQSSTWASKKYDRLISIAGRV